MNTNLITQAGYDKLSAELHHLKNVERPEISKAVGEARELGDLRENAEYQTSKEEQELIEGRINFLEKVLMESEVFDQGSIEDKNVVHFSAIVKIKDLNNNDIMTIKLVGEYEADIKNHTISISSPLGSSLLNKKISDIVTFNAPSGEKEYEILAVSY